ncbi:hypothetical protein [Neobacillus sp. YIM B06451]|uniref:hypothetical protein n=1 Tax=Neobacillus sp. YIM B06451 TaxID=3070994 RepID=UPI00292F3333|nr:hypothetical protein [Neobacillus sp. YIM B06451]
MKIRLADFLIKEFNPDNNMELDIEWIIGYSNRENMRKLNYHEIKEVSDNYGLIEVPDSVWRMVSREINNEDFDQIEKAINLLYISLYVLGGRN